MTVEIKKEKDTKKTKPKVMPEETKQALIQVFSKIYAWTGIENREKQAKARLDKFNLSKEQKKLAGRFIKNNINRGFHSIRNELNQLENK